MVVVLWRQTKNESNTKGRVKESGELKGKRTKREKTKERKKEGDAENSKKEKKKKRRTKKGAEEQQQQTLQQAFARQRQGTTAEGTSRRADSIERQTEEFDTHD